MLWARICIFPTVYYKLSQELKSQNRCQQDLNLRASPQQISSLSP